MATSKKFNPLSIPADGTVRDAEDCGEKEPGVYVYFGMWKGPFDCPSDAEAAYAEWVWERNNS